MVQSITDVGLTTWRDSAELLGLQAEREAEELGEVQDRHVELAADDALGQRLLEVEVEVAQRARRDEAVGLGVDASPRWRPACLSEASLFIVMIGKPQHLCWPA